MTLYVKETVYNTASGLNNSKKFQMLKPYNNINNISTPQCSIPYNTDSAILQRINSNIETQIPQGLQDTRQITVTDSIYDLFTEGGDRVDWTSVQICNNGPDDVYYDINDWTNPEAPLVPGQCQSIDFRRRGAITRIYFKCNNGETATVSVFGVE